MSESPSATTVPSTRDGASTSTAPRNIQQARAGPEPGGRGRPGAVALRRPGDLVRVEVLGDRRRPADDVHAHGRLLQGLHRQRHRVGQRARPDRHDGRPAATERRRSRRGERGPAHPGRRHRDRADPQRAHATDVRHPQPHALTGRGEPHDVPHGGVGQAVGARALARRHVGRAAGGLRRPQAATQPPSGAVVGAPVVAHGGVGPVAPVALSVGVGTVAAGRSAAAHPASSSAGTARAATRRTAITVLLPAVPDRVACGAGGSRRSTVPPGTVAPSANAAVPRSRPAAGSGRLSA
nr:hypothetical protein [Angustibacter aerolatus]